MVGEVGQRWTRSFGRTRSVVGGWQEVGSDSRGVWGNRVEGRRNSTDTSVPSGTRGREGGRTHS